LDGVSDGVVSARPSPVAAQRQSLLSESVLADAVHRAVLETALRRALTDLTLPAAVPERDAFAIHAVVLRYLEMRARGRLALSYHEARDEITGLFLPLP
jgi:hypothetical protein